MDKLLLRFIREPERAFHVRELAQIVKKSPTTTSKYLKTYQKNGILVFERKLNHLLFKANTNSPLFKEIKRTQNIRQLQKSGFGFVKLKPRTKIPFELEWQKNPQNKLLLDKAAQAFSNVASQFPGNPKVSDALLKLGIVE